MYPQIALQLPCFGVYLKFGCAIDPAIDPMAVSSSAVSCPDLLHCHAYSMFKQSIDSIRSKYR